VRCFVVGARVEPPHQYEEAPKHVADEIDQVKRRLAQRKHLEDAWVSTHTNLEKLPC